MSGDTDENIVHENPPHNHYSARDQLNVKAVIPAAWGIQVAHAVADLGINKGEALREAVKLFLRYHGYGQGLPEPLAPKLKGEANGR